MGTRFPTTSLPNSPVFETVLAPGSPSFLTNFSSRAHSFLIFPEYDHDLHQAVELPHIPWKGKTVRILIVEDDERIVSFMKRGLEAEDFNIDVASGTSQAIDMVNARFYDLLIIDIFLGADDGLDLCHSLRRRRVVTPILIMTAKGTPETEKASKEVGADAYLAKPFAFEDLIATIARFRTPASPSEHRREVHAK